MAANDAVYSDQSQVTLQNSNGSSISSGNYQSMSTSGLSAAQIANRPLGLFKIKAAGFSGAPTAGAYFILYEQRTDGTDQADAPSDNNKRDWLHSWAPNLDSGADTYYVTVPIHKGGATYHLYWYDPGSVSLSANWGAWVIPTTYGPSAS